MSSVKAIRPLSNTEIAAFSSQLSMMLSSGITIDEALRLLSDDAATLEGKAIIKTIYEVLEQGNYLYQSMESSGLFPKYVIDMVNIGEMTGNLDKVFDSLSDYYEREEAISENIRHAVTYPLIMLLMMFCVIMVLMTRVLPVFRQVYDQLGTGVSTVSQIILDTGAALSNYSVAILIGLLLLIILYFYFSGTENGRRLFGRFAAIFPLTSELYEQIAAGHFASGMALAIGAGYKTNEAVHLVFGLITNEQYLKKLTLCRAMVDDGNSFSEAAVHSGIFNGTYGRMVSVGYKSGHLEKVLEQLAAHYELDVDRSIANILSVLEPTLVAILSITVGLVLLSVMLPLMSIMGSLG